MPVDPMTLLLIAGAILQVWTAVNQRSLAKTPEEHAAADAKVNEAWAAAEALIAPHVAGARDRLARHRAGESVYGPPRTVTEAIRASMPGPSVQDPGVPRLET